MCEIAQAYDLTFAAVSKHLKMLEKASLVVKRRRGKRFLVYLLPKALKEASDYLGSYNIFWKQKLDTLEEYLEKGE